MGDQSEPEAWAFAPQAPVGIQILCSLYSSEFWLKGNQVNAGFAPPASEMSTTERFRRLARLYIEDMKSRVNSVNLEPGPYGRAQVVIVVEIGDILGEVIN